MNLSSARVAILGIGSQAGKLARALAKCGVKPYCFFHPEKKRIQAFDGDFGAHNIGGATETFDVTGVQRFHSLSDLLDSSPDLVVVASPSWEHENQAIAVARRGIAVAVEKPWLTPAGTRVLMNTAEEKEVPLYGLLPLCYWEPFRPVIDEISSGKAGKIHRAEFFRQCETPGSSNLIDPRGGGVEADFNYHNIHTLVRALGRPDRVKTTGRWEKIDRYDTLVDSESRYKFGSDSSNQLVEDGALLTCRACWKEAGTPFKHSFVIEGSKRSFQFDGQKFEVKDPESTWREQPCSDADGYEVMMRQVLECLSENKPSEEVPLASLRDTTDCVSSGYVSLQVGEEVEIKPLY